MATTSSISTNFFVNFMVVGSLNQVWSLLNNMQIVQYIRLFNAKTPGNLNAFADFLDGVTNFDIFYFE